MFVSKIIEQQLKKTQNVDISNYNPETNTYIIKKRNDIKIEENCMYLIKLKDSAFSNTVVINNWNNGFFTSSRYLKIDVHTKMTNMIKVVGVGYNIETQQDLISRWSGWLCIDNIEILEKL